MVWSFAHGLTAGRMKLFRDSLNNAQFFLFSYVVFHLFTITHISGSKLAKVKTTIESGLRVMSKKRGLSLEEKRQKMMEIFYERKGVFQLKELEKIAPKAKGITSMSVKDVVQSLVDDGMVDSDRIGTSNYFWAFPSKASNTRKRKIADLSAALGESERKRVDTKKLIAKATVGKEESHDRTEVLQRLAEKKAENSRLKAELEKYRECDPEVLDEVKRQTLVAREAVNRWTDNIFTLKSWCKKKFNMEEQTIDKHFGIPEDFDYVE